MNGKQLVRSLGFVAVMAGTAGAQPSTEWAIHATDRPQPPVVAPGNDNLPVKAPADAVVLFDGKDLSKWVHGSGKPAEWTVQDGYFEVKARTSDLLTRESFGPDMHLHVEWAAPVPVRGEGQGRGNSGVYLMNKYEVQVLDSYRNQTYPDGQAASIYGQYPPSANASRPPGEWQSYDIYFKGPRWDSSGTLVQPARVTVIHNGVTVQDEVTLSGPTGHYARPPYEQHPDKAPILLQDHGDAVRFRNIWIRELR
jgi:hypothetical protein